MIKAVIFDWGGVIAPEKDGGWIAYFAKMLNLPTADARKVWLQAYKGLNNSRVSEEKFWEKVEMIVGHALPNHKSDMWLAGLVGAPWPEMLAYVDELKKKLLKQPFYLIG